MLGTFGELVEEIQCQKTKVGVALQNPGEIWSLKTSK